jgi:3-hydroxyacyl-CoA dehydrogenase
MVLVEAFGERMAPSEAMTRVVGAGRTGRKGKNGFYRYDDSGQKGRVDESVYELIGGERRPMSPEEIVQRCVLAMVNEAVLCLEEGVLRSPRDGDIGAVFGVGFPPFRGGPFRYVDSESAEKTVEQLEDLNARFPSRFAPAALLLDMASGRRSFYPVQR